MLDLGEATHNAQAAAHCVGFQDPQAFWQVHDELYARQGEIFGATVSFYREIAERVGVDGAEFQTCYENRTGHDLVETLDRVRRDEGITRRPTIQINDQPVFGAQQFGAYQQVIEDRLP